MPTNEIFDSAVCSKGDLAGVFEYDGETGYFYLYNNNADEAQKVLDSIHIITGKADFSEADVSIRWDLKEQKVGLFIKDVLWAVFNAEQRAKYGGNFMSGGKPSLPTEAKQGFAST